MIRIDTKQQRGDTFAKVLTQCEFEVKHKLVMGWKGSIQYLGNLQSRGSIRHVTIESAHSPSVSRKSKVTFAHECITVRVTCSVEQRVSSSQF